MGIVEDLLKALDRIPIWKRLGEIPSEVDGLKERVEAVERQLGGRWPGDVCRYCGKQAARLHQSLPPTAQGVIQETWHCADCGQYDNRAHKVGAR